MADTADVQNGTRACFMTIYLIIYAAAPCRLSCACVCRYRAGFSASEAAAVRASEELRRALQHAPPLGHRAPLREGGGFDAGASSAWSRRVLASFAWWEGLKGDGQ
eukprot:1696777-Pleurochrysis_carterae.AAC.2